MRLRAALSEIAPNIVASVTATMAEPIMASTSAWPAVTPGRFHCEPTATAPVAGSTEIGYCLWPDEIVIVAVCTEPSG